MQRRAFCWTVLVPCKSMELVPITVHSITRPTPIHHCWSISLCNGRQTSSSLLWQTSVHNHTPCFGQSVTDFHCCFLSSYLQTWQSLILVDNLNGRLLRWTGRQVESCVSPSCTSESRRRLDAAVELCSYSCQFVLEFTMHSAIAWKKSTLASSLLHVSLWHIL